MVGLLFSYLLLHLCNFFKNFILVWLGVEAEHAANVFYYLTYEGKVDLDSITDTVTKEVFSVTTSTNMLLHVTTCYFLLLHACISFSYSQTRS